VFAEFESDAIADPESIQPTILELVKEAKAIHRFTDCWSSNLLRVASPGTPRLVVLVGQRKALAIAVRNDDGAERFSGLYDRLLGSHFATTCERVISLFGLFTVSR
jgi:hypothetical protein